MLPEIHVFGSRDEAGTAAAEAIIETIAGEDEPVLGVATGSSPLPVYDEFARRVQAGRLDLSHASAFALDEYLGLPRGHEQTYRRVLTEQFAARCGVDPSRVHVPAETDSRDPAADAVGFERAIADTGGVDVQILGIGANGHIGFNEPGSAFDSRTRVQQLAARTRRDNARFFARADDVPTHAVTQGIGTILEARHIVVVANGAGKAAAVAAALQRPPRIDVPASALQEHPHVRFFLDEEAASQL